MPTFGVTEVGVRIESGDQQNNAMIDSGSPASNGTADSISVYVSEECNGKQVQCALYDNGKNFIAATEKKACVGVVDHWETFSFSAPKPGLTGGSNYYMAVLSDEVNARYNYKADAGGICWGETMLGFVWEDPIDAFDWTWNNFAWIMYCTYTESAGTTEIGRLRGVVHWG